MLHRKKTLVLFSPVSCSETCAFGALLTRPPVFGGSFVFASLRGAKDSARFSAEQVNLAVFFGRQALQAPVVEIGVADEAVYPLERLTTILCIVEHANRQDALSPWAQAAPELVDVSLFHADEPCSLVVADREVV